MGFNLLKRSCSVYPVGSPVKAPNPDPLNFKVTRIEKYPNSLLAFINYPDCTNFEGNKVLVYYGLTVEDFQRMTEIDPHFENKHESPIARFKPTIQGIRMARKFAESL